MRIAVDAMGTDERPSPDVLGAVLAAREYNCRIVLVGDQARVQAELKKHDVTGLVIDVVHAEQEIKMDDKPSLVLKGKPKSSLHVGLSLVKDKQADAFVTMGNTGAVFATAMLGTLSRIPGVKRPALTTIYAVKGQRTIFLDMGANADAKPEWLAQFAIMGSIYAQNALGMTSPRVATLCNGEEEGKGNQLTKDAQELLKTLKLNYIGHIEPKEILEHKADVVVMDGFVGNIFLKTFEGSIRYFGEVVREELLGSALTKLGALLIRPALRKVRQRLDTSEIGGAPLLGVNGVVIVGHGSANAVAIKNAIHQAQLAVTGNIVQAIAEHIAEYDL